MRAVVDFRRQQRRGQPRKKRGYAITYQSMNNNKFKEDKEEKEGKELVRVNRTAVVHI